MSSILIIEDERSIRNTLKDILDNEGYETDLAENGEIGIKKIKQNDYNLIFTDIKMPKVDGIEVLEKSKELKPEIPIIMISGHGDIETAVDCIKKGAFDFIQKPLDLNRMLITIKNATDKTQLIKQTKILKKRINKKYKMVGESESIKQIKQMIDKVAETNARVLITGENGTGKEVVAHWIHEKSNRSSAPFVEVNCAAIPSELIESELFGHEKGAFTSAHKQRSGKFEQAHGGTLFLDEIGDMSLSAQAKILRALQENKISRVGSNKDINVDVRIIAATNKDLKTEIDNKTFREDLYHRLSVIVIKVPTLNQRLNDIPILSNYFIDQICNEYGKPKLKITENATELLKQKQWTGNIREFRNIIERLVIFCNKEITEKDVKKYLL